MKIKLILIVAAALAFSTFARADLFPAGYTFTYHFDALPLIPEPVIITAEALTIGTGGTAPPLTSTLSWEMFEGLPIGLPVASGTWSGFDIPLAGIPHGTWQDGEGSFRISVLSGAQVISDVSIYLPQFGGPSGGYTGYVYELTVTPPAVPESTSSSLICLALLAAALCRWYNRRGANSIEPGDGANGGPPLSKAEG
jgi:hypothetical protein